MYIDDIEITRREVLFSVIIVLLMLGIGFFLNSKVVDSVNESNGVYYKALKIDNNATQFKYGMETNAGNALVYGDFKAIDGVTFEELESEARYLYVSKLKERYTSHTRAASKTVNGKKVSYIETYYTWDYVSRDSKQVDVFTFIGVEFGIDKLNLSGTSHIKTIGGVPIVGSIKETYSGIQADFAGSVLVNLKDNSMFDVYENSTVTVRMNETIPDVIKSLESSVVTSQVIFWIVWIFVIAGAVFLFFYIDNNWLEN